MPTRLLIVDDDATIRASLSEALEEEGYEVRCAESADRALASSGEGRPDIVLADVHMPGMSRLELLGLLRERSPSTDVVMMTAYDDMPTVVTAMREGAADLLVKPVDLHDLRRAPRRRSSTGHTAAPSPGTARPPRWRSRRCARSWTRSRWE